VSVSSRILSHSQYEELARYEHGRPSWMFGGSPSKSLTRSYLLRIVPNSGHDRKSSAFEITLEGKLALARYRDRYGIDSHGAA